MGNVGPVYDATATATTATAGTPGAYDYEFDDPTVDGDDASVSASFDQGALAAYCHPDADAGDVDRP